MSIQGAVRVNSIREEYEYLGKQRCACGGGWNRQSQALLFDESQVPHDKITVKCAECGKTADFYFDVSAFFGKPPVFE
ncbi:MAG: hypothetical protein FJX76_29095 [Armatimonadetes bacterium]|nr:hypothetical protein [Armatimonadota bacterium]